jgi:acyl-coenzyme A thioesterase PaaI-like protein
MSTENKSLQDYYAPESICYGCGPANEKGLRIKSYVDGDDVVAEWTPEKHHEAFEGMLNGGIIGTLLDCHSNWCAAWHLMNHMGEEHPPCTVTANYSVKLLRPAPSAGPVKLVANLVEVKGDRALVKAKLLANDGKVCAICEGLFVAVKEGHPAYHRW